MNLGKPIHRTALKMSCWRHDYYNQLGQTVTHAWPMPTRKALLPRLHVLTPGVRSSLMFLWVPPRIYSHPLTRLTGKQIWGTFWSPDSRPDALLPAPNTHVLLRSFRPGREARSFTWTLSTLVPSWAGRWQEVMECLTDDQDKWHDVLLVCALWWWPERNGETW